MKKEDAANVVQNVTTTPKSTHATFQKITSVLSGSTLKWPRTSVKHKHQVCLFSQAFVTSGCSTLLVDNEELLTGFETCSWSLIWQVWTRILFPLVHVY